MGAKRKRQGRCWQKQQLPVCKNYSNEHVEELEWDEQDAGEPGGGGFKVACGFRQSGLFRLRSIGGVKGYVGAGFTIGDEDGFKDSLKNTEQHHQPQPSGPYVIPNNVHTHRSLPPAPSGYAGQYSQPQGHFIPIPTEDPNLQHKQKMQYLQTLQDQLDLDHQNVQMQAADQRSQKMLEQQMYRQGGILLPVPSSTTKVKRAGGLTKRASLWNWPSIFGRGKGGNGSNSKKKPKHRDFDGPPPNRRGGPPPHGPPSKNKHGRWDRPPGKNGPPPGKNGPPPGKNGPPPGKNGPPPGKHGPPGRREERFHDKHGGPGRRGPKFNPHSRPPPEKVSDNFLGHMKNPFLHLQDNFIGRPHSQEVRLYPHEHNHDDEHERHPQHRHQNFHQPASIEANPSKVPQTLMMPPAGPPSGPPRPDHLPKFKKIPNNLKSKKEEEADAAAENEHTRNQHQHPHIDRRMHDADEDLQHGDYYNTPPSSAERRLHQNDPAGLQMLKRTENFGTIFHLVNPDGTPVNMQFEKQPIVPPGIGPYPTQQQQHQAMGSDMSYAGIPHQHQQSEVGGPELDSPLATAVYDPNIFPDIYFTTTEKLKNPDLNLLAGSGNYGGISQELLDNPLLYGLGENQIKRILGASSSEIGKSKIKSNEMSTPGDGEIVITRRKMRRKKKFRTNQADTSESDTTGSDNSTPKRRRKGRRKKYKLQKMKINEIFTGSTERMGLAVDGGEEQASTEMKTEAPTPVPLTTTPAPTTQVKNKSTEDNTSSGERKTSFSFPSGEDVRKPILTSLDAFQALLSQENKIDSSAAVTTTNRTSTEETTTNVPFSFSTFGYYDALGNKNSFNDDYDFSLSAPSGPGAFAYDPRYPPDHEINRGHNMTKFIRPRMKNKNNPSTASTTIPTNSPFILYDMTGNRTQSKFSSKFHQDSSGFRIDGDLQPNRAGDAFHNVPFYGDKHGLHGVVGTSAHHQPGQHNTNENGVYVKFDSNEWHGSGQKPQYHGDLPSDPFTNHYNRTSLSSGFYGSNGPSKEYALSGERPWERKSAATPSPSPMYPGFSENAKHISSASASLEHNFFGTGLNMFGAPRPTPTHLPGGSGENKQRQLHQNLFGGSSADVSDWASPNFWGDVQQPDRYSPSSDFEAQNNNLKRLLNNFDSANGLKEMKPVDLSSPTPLPMPAPSPTQNTMEEMNDDYFLAPSTPGSRWGKHRRRKGKPTTATPTSTMTPPPMMMSSSSPKPSSTQVPAKWMAVMSNEVDVPRDYFENFNLPPSGPDKGGKGAKFTPTGIEIKFRSGEERDPEEEEQESKHEQVNATNMDSSSQFDIMTGFKAGVSGFPGVMVHDFDTSNGYGFGEPGGMKRGDMPGDSEISYYPIVSKESGSEVRGGHNQQVTSGGSMQSFGPHSGPPPRMENHHPIFPVGPPGSSSSRKDFMPSAEDLGPMSHPLPPSDNPFKLFEKQNYPVGDSGGGFVSAQHELNAMEKQISQFSDVPVFLRRDDSAERKMNGGGGHGHDHHHGQGPSMEHHPQYNGPPREPPSASDMANLPGFANVEMPRLEPPHPDSAQSEIPQSPLSAFGPSGFPNNLREHQESGQAFSGPPPTGFPPSMNGESGLSGGSGNDNQHAPPSHPGPHDRPHDAPWNFNPLEHNDVELGPPHHMHTNEHPRPGDRPPHMAPGRGPPVDSDEGFRHGPPPHMRDGPQRPPPGHMRHEHEGPRRPPPQMRDEHTMRPPHRDHERPGPPGRHHDFPPRGPPGPPGSRDHDGRPPHREFDRDFPPRGDGPPRHPDDRFRDGPGRGPPSHRPPQESRPPHGGPPFHPPRKDDSFHHERKDFRDGHKTIENLRPPPKSQFHDQGHDHRGDHSNFGSWHDEKEAGGRGKFPPLPQGVPPHVDIPKISNHPDQRPKHLPPPPHGGKKHFPPHPTKVPSQHFKPPPPHHRPSPVNIFKNMLSGPFGKSHSNRHPPHPMPPPHSKQHSPNSRPPPPNHHQHHPPTRKPSVKSDHVEDIFSKIPFHDPPHPNNPNNYINPFNDRYEPPPPQGQSRNHQASKHDSNSHRHPHPPPSPPPKMPNMAGSRLPFLPFPAGPPGNDFDSSFLELDQDPHPPTLHPIPQDDNSLPVRDLARPPPSNSNKSPIYPSNQRPPTPGTKKIDEKSKVLQAFETLNKADVDVIQSLAADKYGPNFIDRIKTKSNMMDDYQQHRFPLKVEALPIATTTTSAPTALFDMLAAMSTTKRPIIQEETNKLTALLNMINKKPNGEPNSHLQPMASASTMGSHTGSSNDQLASLLQKLSKPVTTSSPTSTTRLAELPSNPGLVSLASLHQPPGQDIKSLQAQIAKAIIAKAQRKPEQQQQPERSEQSVNNNNSPLAVLQQLAQNRMDMNNHGKNYTSSQIDTLRKLIALNNIEQKLVKPKPPPTQEEQLKKLQAMLPSAVPTTSMSRKMLDSTTAHGLALNQHHHQHHPNNNNLLQDPDPTILALKAIAMSKAHGVNPQPSMRFPQQVKPTEPSSQPIAVDLSAILSPSPPVVEQMSRTRRLTNVRNAPKSFFPANATLGFEDPSLALLSDFHCDEQSFFPGLYADTELGCRVFHLCAKTEAGFMTKSFRCPKETVFDQEVLRCNWNLFVECPSSKNKYHFNKYLSQSFQFLKILGEFSANIQKSDATMTG